MANLTKVSHYFLFIALPANANYHGAGFACMGLVMKARDFIRVPFFWLAAQKSQ